VPHFDGKPIRIANARTEEAHLAFSAPRSLVIEMSEADATLKSSRMAQSGHCRAERLAKDYVLALARQLMT
jgi:hypothetical protein